MRKDRLGSIAKVVGIVIGCLTISGTVSGYAYKKFDERVCSIVEDEVGDDIRLIKYMLREYVGAENYEKARKELRTFNSEKRHGKRIHSKNNR